MSDESQPQVDNEASDDLLSRRGFIKVVAAGVGACYAGAIGYPVYQYLASPVEQAAMAAAVNEVTLPQAASLPKNTALMFRFGSKPSILIHHDDDTWSAMSAVCTHLGCTAGYVPEKKVIFCPCHGGTYDARTGANISGPPPKPLTPYKVEITDGKVIVTRA